MSRQCCVTQAMLRSGRWARDRAAASRPGIKHDADVSTIVMMIVDDDGDDGDNVDDDCDVDYDFSGLIWSMMQMCQRRNPWGISSISESSLASASF